MKWDCKQNLAFIASCIICLSSCLSQEKVIRNDFQYHNPLKPLQSDISDQKISNLVIILDASASMSVLHKGKTRLAIAKQALLHLNETMTNLKINIAMRTIGKSFWPLANKTNLIFGFSPYSPNYFRKAIEGVLWMGGKSPLSQAIDALNQDLVPIEGYTAIVILSDGEEMNDAPILAAENLKNRFGDKICIYTIQIGDSDEGKKIMASIASISQCGTSTNADLLASDANMMAFANTLFIQKMKDQDKDGIGDDVDQCNDTPRGISVEINGCPKDSDADGVYDYLDHCPHTPLDIAIDQHGCPQKDESMLISPSWDSFEGDKSMGQNFQTTRFIQPNQSYQGRSKEIRIDDIVYDDQYLVSNHEPNEPNSPAFESFSQDQKRGVISTRPDYSSEPIQSTHPPSEIETFQSPSPKPSTYYQKTTTFDTDDQDNDGVFNYQDQCPNTPIGARVNNQGCWIMGNITFSVGSWEVKPIHYPDLFEILAVLKRNPELHVEIQGHTDNVGSQSYNIVLSNKRAISVKQYFERKGIDSKRLSIQAFGYSRPVASNHTHEGQTQNRRVQFKTFY